MESFDEIESIFHSSSPTVYRIPPRVANEGYRANDWGDLASPLWKGRLRIIETSKGAALHLEDSQTGELFAKADYDPTKPSVEAVLDSSRYFVIRVEDGGRKAYIGLGFAERTDSFDFNVTLQDYTKRARSLLNAATTSEEQAASPHVPAGPKADYSLKEGQTFSISIPGRSKPATSGTANIISSNSSSSGAIPLLPPPPSSTKKR
ncbi:hypothetical protein CVT24_003368 [Panaeolus cyanescens]|uniref:NECAP PHear domain-containing protein n=1 Tax=Panaeolus cyanescens TaxID=181874 RepID=A0A409Y734_9AGAR|nr:hypothetical protein CVT24_003368 [Panaeolus cyanescens]